MGEGDVSVESPNSDGSSTRTHSSVSETTSSNELPEAFYLDESNTQDILNQGSHPDASRQESPRPVDTDGSEPLDTPATPGNASLPASDDAAGRREPAPATPGKEESIPPVSLFKDTPHKPYTSHPGELECGFGESERTAIRTDMGNQVPVMSNDHLFEKVLPPLRRCFTIDKICDTLKEEGVLVGDEEKGFSWKGLENTKRGDKENEVYNGPLTEIFNMLVKAADKLLEEQKELDDMSTGPMSPLTSLPSSQNTDSRTPPNEVKGEENSLHDPSSSPLPILTPSPTPSHTSLQTPSDVDPCTPSPTRSQSNLQDDSQTLGSVQNPVQKSTVVFRAEGTREFYPSKFKPDGTLYLRDPKETLKIDGKEKILLYNSAVPFVFKLTESTEHFDGNIRQILHYMVLTTYLDFCRRFTFGIQINDTKLRVWFRSRSIVLVSEGFDVNKNYKDIVKIFLSLLYASKEELGWDTSITTSLKEKPKEKRKRKRKGRHKGEGEDSIRYYSMEIDGREITTDSDSVISEFKAKGLIGSGARIYKARLATNKKDVVLKDFWLLDGRDPEPKIRDQIKSAITKDVDKSFADSHILKPLAHGDVQVNGENDHTKEVQLRGQSQDMSKQFDIPLPDKEGGVKASTLGSKGVQNYARRIAVELERNRRAGYPHRSHYRIVFEEVATPFDKIDNIKDILLVLIDVLHTLQHVHAAGWVHRDISIGNVYLYTDPETQEKKGMIGDFEYAKMAGIGAQNEVRTGTPDFMAVEISRQSYLFAKLSKDIAEGKGLDDYMQRHMDKRKNPRTDDTPEGIYYNYIHDLESVWWIAVWALFNFEKKDIGANEIDSQAAKQRKLNRDILFPGTVGNQDRIEFLSMRKKYAKKTKYLPEYFENLSTTLGTIAEAIIELYQLKELNYQVDESNKEEPILWDESSTIHGIFIGLLSNVTEEFEIVRIPGIDDEILPATQSNKRRTDEQDSERSNKRQRSTLETASQ